MKDKLKSHKTYFLQHLLSVATKYRTNAVKAGVSTDGSDDSWGVNIWKDRLRRTQYSAASVHDGPEVNDEFTSICELKNILKDRGVTSFDKPQNRRYDRKYTKKRGTRNG